MQSLKRAEHPGRRRWPALRARWCAPAWLAPAAASLLAAFAVARALLVGGGSAASPVAWAPMLPAVVAAASAAARTGRLSGLAEGTRLIWTRVRVALWLVGAATVLDVAEMILRSGALRRHPAPPSTLLYIGSITVMVWVLPRLRISEHRGVRAAGAWLRTALDLTIVVLAAGMFGFFFSRHHLTSSGLDVGEGWLLLLITALSVAVVTMYLQVTVSGPKAFDPVALVLMALGALTGGLCSLVNLLTAGQPFLAAGEISTPVTACMLALAAERQRRVSSRSVTSRDERSADERSGDERRADVLGAPAARPRSGERLKRAMGLLPYAAIAATDVLLLVWTRDMSVPDRLIVAFAVALSATVVVRQIIAFRDNGRLVGRLNGSMRELRRQEERFRSLVQYSSDIILVTDVGGRFQYISPSLERVLGARPAGWLGRPVAHFTMPDDLPVLQDTIEALLEDPETPVTLSIRLGHADGSWRWLEIVAVNRLADPIVGGIVGNARDITETRLYQERLAYQAEHDELTLLANRTVFTRRAAEALASRRPGTEVLLALVDLDDFKMINDSLGHAVGDALLVAVAARLSECVREGDTVARLGGDEFAVLVEDRKSGEATAVIDRIVAALSGPIRAAGHDLLVQASIGLVQATPGMDASELLRRSDVAMYAVKERGKSGCLHYTEEMDARAVEHARMGAELELAMAANDLHVVYQPVVLLPDRRVAAVEALVRWRHPIRGLVSPAEFVPVAEHNGQIVALGRWVLWEACRRLAAWRRDGLAGTVRMSVNVSARQLRDQWFVRTVSDVLELTGLAPDDLMLEITETAVFDGGVALETVHALHALGVGIALDDFGTGHSSLGLLRSCPVDVIKVDKLFIEGVAGTVEEAAIATSIAEIARAMGLRAVAEGVETEAQAHRLQQLGYRYAQGFLFGRPLAAHDIEPMLPIGTAGSAASGPSWSGGRAGGTAGRRADRKVPAVDPDRP